MEKEILISCIIPASKKDAESQNLKDLIASIKAQDFPQDQIEILVITEGDSEQAKAIGIKRAKGELCAMFCADNMIMEKDLFRRVYVDLHVNAEDTDACFPWRYAYIKADNSLNRYFSLIGGNDPICYYLGKNDRDPHVNSLRKTANYQPSYGCNGFFYRSEAIKATDLDHYYPMDNATQIEGYFSPLVSEAIWHRTSDNLINFLIKRYKYARDLYSDRNDRRWKMVDTAEDYKRIALFVFSTLTVIPALLTSFRGYAKIRDIAWFWHWPVCIGFLITYGILTLRNLCLVLSSFRRLEDLKRFGTVLSPCGHRLTKTSR